MKKTDYQQFSFVNGFDGSQLRSRIKMMNRRQRSRWRMLKYPLMLMLAACLTMAFVTKEKTTNVLKQIPKIFSENEPKEKKVIHQKNIVKTEPLAAPSVPAGRYAFEKEGFLYFLITAKMNLGELGELQKVIAKKTSDKLEIKSVKFESLNNYITEIDLEFEKRGDRLSIHDDSHEQKPIESLPFRLPLSGTNPKRTSFMGYYGKARSGFAKIISEDEAHIKKIVDDNKKVYEIDRTEQYILRQTGREYGTVSFKGQDIPGILKRTADADGSVNLQRGDFMNLINRKLAVTDTSIVYMLDSKTLTDNELTKVRSKDIEKVKIYTNADISADKLEPHRKSFILLISKQP